MIPADYVRIIILPRVEAGAIGLLAHGAATCDRCPAWCRLISAEVADLVVSRAALPVCEECARGLAAESGPNDWLYERLYADGATPPV